MGGRAAPHFNVPRRDTPDYLRLAGAFLAGAFLTAFFTVFLAVFFAGAFLAGAFLTAFFTAFLAGAFLAGAFFAAVATFPPWDSTLNQFGTLRTPP